MSSPQLALAGIIPNDKNVVMSRTVQSRRPVLSWFTACYQAPSRAIARQLATGIRADYANVLPSALSCFEDDFEACIAHLRLPVTHRRFARTTSHPPETSIRRLR
jgi:hypothetical protein